MKYLDKALSSLVFMGAVAFFALAIGVVHQPGSAHAQDFGANFSIDETCGGTALCAGGGFGGTLTGVDNIGFTYTAVIEQEQTGPTFLDGDDIFFEKGIITWSSYNDDSNTPIASALNAIAPIGYNVYGLFSASGTATASAVQPGFIEVEFSSFEVNFFIDTDQDTTFTPAANTGVLPGSLSNGLDDLSDPAVAGGGAEDIFLASATLLGRGDANVDPVDAAEGNFEVIVTDFSEVFLDLFSDPTPFYEIMTLGGNTQGLTIVDATGEQPNPFIAEIGGGGQIFFPVPEPSTLGMFGIALIAFGFLATRRQRRSFGAVS